jgi:hypothetical protein
MKSTLLILSLILGGCLAVAMSSAHADTPWARDCVTWYGGSIDFEERTKENCPNGRSHWDGDIQLSPNARPNSQPYSVLLPSGNYLVIPNTTTGRVQAVIQTSRGK